MLHYYLYILPAFLMGLFGSIHCIGMCGGIVSTLCYGCSKNSNTQVKSKYNVLFYNFGRVITYTLLGGLSGTFGLSLSRYVTPHSQYALRYMASVVIMLSGIYIAGWFPAIFLKVRFTEVFWKPLKNISKKIIPIQNLKQAFALGGLWGLIPCGLVYSTLLYAMMSGSGLYGASVMFFFGLGTLPAMLILGVTLECYRNYFSDQWLKPMFGLILISFGILSFLWLLSHSVEGHSELACHS